mmetsp:Transcript_17210/g.28802  ORF Transcript_17210/g.28802 Transcript_17210/m.28802 type:complete len:456 (+) Transcript_17210:161-1528(+)
MIQLSSTFLFLTLLLGSLQVTTPLVIGISHNKYLLEVTLLRRHIALPHWHQTRSLESLGVDSQQDGLEVEEPLALVIDTMGAFIDAISIKFHNHASFNQTSHEEVVIMVYENDVLVWTESIPLSGILRHSSSEHIIDISEGIRSPPSERVKIIDTFTYNGEFIALWRIKHLFHFVDEFIIVEAAYTHPGKNKTVIHCEEPHHRALFAPYMSKITFVVVRDCPAPPVHWSTLMKGHMAHWDYENGAFWRENYQKLFCRFFIRPPSVTGRKTLIFVSDADEVLNTQTLTELIQTEEALGSNDPRSLFIKENVIHPRLYVFYYNFDTVSMHAWEQPYMISSERYEELTDTLYLRVVHGEEAVFIPDGGWHLTYFASYPGFQKKLAAMAHMTAPDFLACEYIRDTIANSRDLFGRNFSTLVPRQDLAGVPAALLPPFWEELQQTMDRLHADTCSCCSEE